MVNYKNLRIKFELREKKKYIKIEEFIKKMKKVQEKTKVGD